MLRGFVIGLFACSLLVGCSDYRTLNEKNPYFQKAEQARAGQKYDQAISFYVKCLQFSPQSHKAHLQLAIIYEENKKDYPQAITHYEAYLAAVNGESSDVRRMLERVEKKLYQELREKYETEAKAREPVAQQEPLAQPGEPESGPTSAQTEPEPIAKPKPMPQIPEPTEPSAPVHTIYVVKDGDNLSRISNKVYGTSKYWDQIFEANRETLPSPEKLRVGQKLVIPDKTKITGGN